MRKPYVHDDRLAGVVTYEVRGAGGETRPERQVLCKFQLTVLRGKPDVSNVQVVDPKGGEICDHCGLSRLD